MARDNWLNVGEGKDDRENDELEEDVVFDDEEDFLDEDDDDDEPLFPYE